MLSNLNWAQEAIYYQQTFEKCIKWRQSTKHLDFSSYLEDHKAAESWNVNYFHILLQRWDGWLLFWCFNFLNQCDGEKITIKAQQFENIDFPRWKNKNIVKIHNVEFSGWKTLNTFHIIEDSIYWKIPMCNSSFCANCKFFIFAQLISLKPSLFIYMWLFHRLYAYVGVFIPIALKEPESEWENVCTNSNIIDVLKMFHWRLFCGSIWLRTSTKVVDIDNVWIFIIDRWTNKTLFLLLFA